MPRAVLARQTHATQARFAVIAMLDDQDPNARECPFGSEYKLTIVDRSTAGSAAGVRC